MMSVVPQPDVTWWRVILCICSLFLLFIYSNNTQTNFEVLQNYTCLCLLIYCAVPLGGRGRCSTSSGHSGALPKHSRVYKQQPKRRGTAASRDSSSASPSVWGRFTCGWCQRLFTMRRLGSVQQKMPCVFLTEVKEEQSRKREFQVTVSTFTRR